MALKGSAPTLGGRRRVPQTATALGGEVGAPARVVVRARLSGRGTRRVPPRKTRGTARAPAAAVPIVPRCGTAEGRRGQAGRPRTHPPHVTCAVVPRRATQASGGSIPLKGTAPPLGGPLSSPPARACAPRGAS